MRSQFLAYYKPNPSELHEMWREAIFALDTNVLLNLYRYTDQTRDDLLKLLERLSPQLWLPHQVGLEFHQHRPEVLAEQVNKYSQAQENLNQLKSKITELFTSRKHPLMDQQLLKRLDGLCGEMNKALDAHKAERERLWRQDPVLEKLSQLFDEKVGAPYAPQEWESLYAEAKKRYEKKIPPGYEDDDKSGEDEPFGDYILWKQLLKKAEMDKKPIIFVTDDAKEDWWWRPKGRTYGPRHELIQEMLNIAGVRFWMYDSLRLLEVAKLQLEQEVSQSSLDEVKEARDREAINADTIIRSTLLRRAKLHRVKAAESTKLSVLERAPDSESRGAELELSRRVLASIESDIAECDERLRTLGVLKGSEGQLVFPALAEALAVGHNSGSALSAASGYGNVECEFRGVERMLVSEVLRRCEHPVRIIKEDEDVQVYGFSVPDYMKLKGLGLRMRVLSVNLER